MSKKEYRIVEGYLGIRCQFPISELVNKLILEGWEPLGAPVIRNRYNDETYYILQAMTRGLQE